MFAVAPYGKVELHEFSDVACLVAGSIGVVDGDGSDGLFGVDLVVLDI